MSHGGISSLTLQWMMFRTSTAPPVYTDLLTTSGIIRRPLNPKISIDARPFICYLVSV